MRRHRLTTWLGAWALLLAASCGEETAAPGPEETAVTMGLDESVTCPEGQVGWRFPNTARATNTQEWANLSGDSAFIEITERYAIEIQQVTCDGVPSATEDPEVRAQCAGLISCAYTPACQGAFVATYTCGASDVDAQGAQNVYTADAAGGANVSLSCAQPSRAALEQETRTECIPRECHGRTRRDLNMQCVADDQARDVAMIQYGFSPTLDRASGDRYVGLTPFFAPQTPSNDDLLRGRDPGTTSRQPFVQHPNFERFVYPIYPGMPYTANLFIDVLAGTTLPADASMVAWVYDVYKPRDFDAGDGATRTFGSYSEEAALGFRCVAFQQDMVADPEDVTRFEPAGQLAYDRHAVAYEGNVSESCFSGARVGEFNAARGRGETVEEFRRGYEYVYSEVVLSYDMEGKAALFDLRELGLTQAGDVSADDLPRDFNPECAPNPQDFYFDSATGTFDMLAYYAQRQSDFTTPWKVTFVDPEVGRRATIEPRAITAREELVIRPGARLNAGSLAVDLEYFAYNLNPEHPFNPFAAGVDIGGAWEDGRSLPEANYAPKNLRASVFIWPYGTYTQGADLWDYKVGEIPLTSPNTEGKTISARLPITKALANRFQSRSPNSRGYIDGRAPFHLFYCIESDQEPGLSASTALLPRDGSYLVNRNGTIVSRSLPRNFTMSQPAVNGNFKGTVYSLELDTTYPFAGQNALATPLRRHMPGCRIMRGPLYVTLDTFVSPLEPIAAAGFSGAPSTTETGDGKMSGANDNDTQIDCMGADKRDCVEVTNGGNRTDGEAGRSTYDLETRLSRSPGDSASAGLNAEMLGFQLIDPTDPVGSSIPYPASPVSASPVTLTLAPDWDAIRASLERATQGNDLPQWNTGSYGGQIGLGIGWGFKWRWQIGPVPVLVTFTVTVGLSTLLEASFQFAPDEDQGYPCVGEDGPCVIASDAPATFIDAARDCNQRGGRLSEPSTQAEADLIAANRPSGDVWIGGQLAYDHPNAQCTSDPFAGSCLPNSKTEYRWLSSGAPFAANAATAAPTFTDGAIFGSTRLGLVTRYPASAGVLYTPSTNLSARLVGERHPYLCTYEAADFGAFLGWSLGLNLGAAAGFNLTGCVPNDNPGFCLGASVNIVALSIKFLYENTYHWLFRGAQPFKRVGNTTFSVPWSLTLLSGAVTASVNFLWFSLSWPLLTYDGFVAAQGSLFDLDFPVSEDL